MVGYKAYRTNKGEVTVEIGDGDVYYRFMFIPEENIVVLPKDKHADVKLVNALEEKDYIREVYSHNKVSFEKV